MPPGPQVQLLNQRLRALDVVNPTPEILQRQPQRRVLDTQTVALSLQPRTIAVHQARGRSVDALHFHRPVIVSPPQPIHGIPDQPNDCLRLPAQVDAPLPLAVNVDATGVQAALPSLCCRGAHVFLFFLIVPKVPLQLLRSRIESKTITLPHSALPYPTRVVAAR